MKVTTALLALCLLGVSWGCSGAASAGPATDAAAAGEGALSAFYRWPDALPGAPGRMLRSEPLPPEFQVDRAAEGLRILYTSTSGVDGAATVVSGMLLLPRGEPPQGGWPLLAWAHGTTGVANACAPSWGGPSPAVRRYLGAWLEEGYAVVATDYQGLGTPGLHPYLVKRAEAHSVLDGIRAALDLRDDLAGEVVLAGQSQGGGAVIASAGLAPEYAPELAIKGAVATGPPYLRPDMPTASAVPPNQIDPGLAYVFYAAQVAVALDAELDASQLFSERALPVFAEAARACIGDLMERVRQAELTQANSLRPGAIERMAVTLVPHYVYPTLALDRPLFIATGTADRDVDPRGQLMLVRDACAAGTLVQARLYQNEDHAGAWLASQQAALAFARAVREERPIEPDCAPAPRPAP